MSYLIKPFDMRTGNTAPGMISYKEKKEDAVADVMSRSSLSKYKNWRFYYFVKWIKDKPVKQFKSKDNE